MRFAVVPSRGRECLKDSVNSVIEQVDHVFVLINHPIDEAAQVVSGLRAHGPKIHVQLDYSEAPVNLSALWNIGLRKAENMAKSYGCQTWDVAIINDDAIAPPEWMNQVCAGIRATGAASACTNDKLARPIVYRQPGAVNLFYRLTGWGFVVAGHKGVRVDERLEWWYGDDDLDWKSRLNGGTALIPGKMVVNQFPNGLMTPELQVQAGKDRETFRKIWGAVPWGQ